MSLKWKGGPLRPSNQPQRQPIKKDYADIMRPLGEKKYTNNLWGSVIMNVEKGGISPSPSPSITPTQSITPTPSITPSISISPTPSVSISPTPSPTLTPTPSPTPIPLLLDTYTGATTAVSVRKLRTAYSGDVMRVRRSSDNTEQDIAFSGNVLDESSLLSFVGTGATDNGFIVTWYDQSGNGNDHTQAVAVSQPKIVDAGVIIKIGNLGPLRPTCRFDGVNDVLVKAGITTGGNTSISIFTSGDSPFANISSDSNLGAISNSFWGFLTSPVYGVQFVNTTPINYIRNAAVPINKSIYAGFYNSVSEVITAGQNATLSTTTNTTGIRRQGSGSIDNFATSTDLQEYILWYGSTGDLSGSLSAIQTNQNNYFNLY